MEPKEWDSILQFVSDGLAQDIGPSVDKQPVSSIVRPPLSRTVSTTQVPTPPTSVQGTPADESEETMISVSTTFFPGANLDVLPTDIVILSADSVFFYVHSHKLLAVSSNGFNSLLPLKSPDPSDDTGNIFPVPHDSVVLNIILHTVYNMSVQHYSPPPEAVIAAVEHLEVYGISVQACLTPPMPLHTLFLGTAPQAPVQFYTLAGAYGLHHLAIPISSFLLSYSLASLTDELAVQMGPLYLKRLFFLHLGRVEALKRLLLPPPQQHAPTSTCDFAEQKKLTRAWALASAYLAWDVKPDLSTHAIEAALRPLGDYLSCDQCKQLLRERINNLVSQWSTVKRTV
ncbi:hypothetical protein BC834DRAFT_970291 [Gloeopeniophorella convolvens]|nr:hypothetical protein BC834DRAFT_970291 [Gloeopeniophorella convolvens]